MNRLIIVGAGGHGKVIADCAIKNGYFDIAFLDDNSTGRCMEFPIIGTSSDLNSLNDEKTDFVIGIGNNTVRKRIAEKYNVNWITLVHPSAQVAYNAEIGKGTVVMANAVINASAKIGEHCIINTSSVVEHDNVLGNFVHISPGATLSGTVSIGECTWIGTGTSVKNNIEICSDTIIGVGSIVIKDVLNKGVYYGIVSK